MQFNIPCPEVRTCHSCGQCFPKSNEFFYITKSRGKQFYRSECKDCTKQQSNARRKPKDVVREQHRAWRAKNSELSREIDKRSQLKNRDAIRSRERLRSQLRDKEAENLRHRKWYSLNKQKILAKKRIYAQTPQAKALKKANDAKRRALISASPTHFTGADLQQIFLNQKGKCAWCHIDLEVSGYHADHIVPLARGGTNEASNICCACPTCNTKKWALMPDVFLRRQM